MCALRDLRHMGIQHSLGDMPTLKPLVPQMPRMHNPPARRDQAVAAVAVIDAPGRTF